MASRRTSKRAAAAETATADKPEKKGKTGLAVGDTLPEFEVETDESTTISSKDLFAESGAVIFFYPRANTGGCTTQACGFRDNYDKLVASGYKVYGMSADKPKSQASWKAKHNFQYPLLCDPTYKVLKVLGVNKGDKGVRRSHLVVAKGGRLEAVHYDISPKASIAEAITLIKEGAAPEEAEAAAEGAEVAAAAEAAEGAEVTAAGEAAGGEAAPAAAEPAGVDAAAPAAAEAAGGEAAPAAAKDAEGAEAPAAAVEAAAGDGAGAADEAAEAAPAAEAAKADNGAVAE